MERHPAITAEFLQRIHGAEDVARIALAHHENLDATGYPRALGEDAISLEARILRVVGPHAARKLPQGRRTPRP